MKRLLLLLLKIVIFFYSTPAAVSAADATINLSLKYGKCDGNQPLAAGGNIVQLGPEKWLLVVADKATGQIDYVQPLSHPTENIDGDFSWTLNPKNVPLPITDPKKELHVVMFVRTPRDDMMTGIDNQIFYGYDGKHAWGKDSQSKPYDTLDKSPFRLAEIKFTYKKDGKDHPLFEAKEANCNTEDLEAWVANHGLYRVEKRNNSPFYTNLYYWPQVGKVFS